MRYTSTAALILSATLILGCATGNDEPDDTTETDGVEDTSTDGASDTFEDNGSDVPEDGSDTTGDDILGTPCSGNWDCQDGVFCNGVEFCDDGTCADGVPIDCDDYVPCTRDECVEEEMDCIHTMDDAECDDGIACNGEETCTPTGGCQDGVAVDCNDDVVCTLDVCHEPDGSCTNELDDLVCDDGDSCTLDTCDTDADTCDNALIDADGDTIPPESCGGPDCDDTDEAIFPGADEDCGDSVDSNCNGLDDASDPACCIGDGDSCDCPIDISVGGTFTGVTDGMTNDYCGSCGASPCAFDGKDMAFYFYVPTYSLVQFAFSGMDWSYYVHIHEDTCHGPEILCQDYFYADEPLTSLMDTGYYYLILDSRDMLATGSYDITMTRSTLTNVTGNDTCATAADISPGHTYGGSVATFTDDHTGSCAYDSGRDAVFRLVLSSTTEIEITSNGTAWDTVMMLYQGPACPGTELLCDDDGGTGTNSRLSSTLSAGTYYVVLDEYSSYGYGDDYLLTVDAL